MHVYYSLSLYCGRCSCNSADNDGTAKPLESSTSRVVLGVTISIAVVFIMIVVILAISGAVAARHYYKKAHTNDHKSMEMKRNIYSD